MLLTWPLLLLLLPLVKVLSASPANLHNHPAHNRTLREQECYEDEYFHRGHCCRTCPAGTRVSVHCTVHHARGICEACPPGYFTASPNGLESCLPCVTCKDDKVLVQECTPIRDAKCDCKPGSYCSPDEPCEICNRCSRCGEGQRIKNLCTSTTDTVCEDVYAPESTSTKANVKSWQTETNWKKSSWLSGPDGEEKGKKTTPIRKDVTLAVPTNSSNDVSGKKALPTEPPDDPAGSELGLYISIPMIVILVVVILLVRYFYCKRKDKDKSKNSLMGNTQNSSENSLQSVQTNGNGPKEEEPCPERQRLMTPESRNVENLINQMAVPAVQGAQSDPVENNIAEPIEGDVETEESPQLGAICEECGKPQPCDKQWTSFFYIVIDNVRPDSILRLVRQLHLNKAAIEQIMKDNANNCKEQNYNLLAQWREQKGTQASMTAVLRELRCDMDLGGCCENIINSLRTKRIPIS